MKKLLLTMLVVLVAMTSCEKSDLNGSLSGETAMVTISAAATSVTRALDDTYTADGAKLTYYVDLYLDGVFYRRYTEAFAVGENAVFNVELFTETDYTILAWADYGKGYYKTDDLTAVTINTDESVYKINTTDRDAFAGKATINVSDPEQCDVTMELVRPFGRVNVLSKDDIPEGYQPTEVSIVYETIYTTYDISTGQVGGGQPLTVKASTVDFIEHGETYADYNGDLSTDYLFAPKEGSITVSFDQTYYKGNTEITTFTGFDNIPVQANFQTNITGKILTGDGTIDITVTDGWSGELAEVIDQETLQQAIDDGVEMIVLSESFPITEEVVIADGHNVTINGSNISDASSVLSRAASSDNYTLTMTGGQFVINGGSLTFSNINLITASNTVAPIKVAASDVALTLNNTTLELGWYRRWAQRVAQVSIQP